MFKTTKAKVIAVVIFCAICIITTVLLVLYKNIDVEENASEINTTTSGEETKVKDVAGIDLEGTYNQNDLTIEEKQITKEKVEIRYCQIYGLKNKIIQDSINKELEEVALNFYKEKVKDMDEVINVFVYMWNSSNFANTASFEVSYTAKIDDDGDGFYQGSKGLNFDLRTGEKISFDKVFTSDAPIEDILRKSAYYSLVQSRTEDSLSGDLIVSDYGDIEDEVAMIINSYKKGKIADFFYTPSYIIFPYDENIHISIDMEDYAEYIAIYNRYLTEESIFEVNNIGIKNLYALTDRYRDIYYYSNYEKGKNYFIDISINCQESDTDEFGKKLAQEKINKIEEEIENVKAYANKYNNNFYILNYYIDIYTGEEWTTKQKITSCNERGNSYEMTVHDFEENIEPIIIEYNRREESGGLPDYIYDFSEMLKIEPQQVMEYYNPETGEKVVI